MNISIKQAANMQLTAPLTRNEQESEVKSDSKSVKKNIDPF